MSIQENEIEEVMNLEITKEVMKEINPNVLDSEVEFIFKV